MPPIQLYDSTLTIGATDVPCYNWHVTLGSYGQLGTADAHTSISALKALGVDFTALSSQANLPVSLTLNGKKVFGGYYMHGFYTFEHDKAHFVCRDYAGVLFDTKRSLAALNIQNQTVSDLVKQIVQRYGQGLTADVGIDDDPFVGTVLNEGAVAITYPQTMWQLLNYLARMVGASIYTTPDQVLNFKTILAGGNNNVYTWRASPDQLGLFVGPATGTAQAQPIENLEFTHQPARNQNFSVVVVSHHQQSTVQTVNTVTVAGQPIPVSKTKTIGAGFYTGNFGIQLKNVLAAQGNGHPIYTYNISGLNPDDCRAMAQGIAVDIARRMLICTLRADGNPSIQPLQQVQIGEVIAGDLLGFADRTLYVNGVDHYFDCPQGEGEGGGLWTEIKALTVPPAVQNVSELESDNS